VAFLILSDAVDDEAPLGFRIEQIAVLPRAAVSRSLMAATHDLAREIRCFVDGFADHKGGELHPMLVHQVENSGDTLVHAVLEDTVRRKSGRPFSIGSSKKPGAPEIG
jgi:hypothetical protein